MGDIYKCKKCGTGYDSDCAGVKYELENTDKITCEVCGKEIEIEKEEEEKKVNN